MPESTLGAAAGTAAPLWKIAIVEDHLLQRALTRHLINTTPDMGVVFSSETLPEFVTWWNRAPSTTKPQLLLLDLMVDNGEPADPAMVKRLVAEGLNVGIFSELTSPSRVRRVLRAGASGVISKQDTVEDIVHAVMEMLHGGTWVSPKTAAILAQGAKRPQLSEQEERTLKLYASGLTMEEVAHRIGIKRDTAAQYIKRVKEKYHAAGHPVSTKLELRAAAISDGLLDD